MSVNFPPQTINNGDRKDGPDFTSLEDRIDMAVEALEGSAYTDSTSMSISDNAAQIEILKGDPAYDPSDNLNDHGVRLDDLESLQTQLVSDLSSKQIYVADIIDNDILAREADLLAAEASIAANGASISANAAAIVATRGAGFSPSTQNNVALYSLFQQLEPLLNDFTGLEDYIVQDQLDLVTGLPFDSNTMNNRNLYDLIDNLTIYASDVSGLEDFATRAYVDALKGNNWNAARTIEAIYTTLLAHAGTGSLAAEVNLFDHELRLDGHDADISGLDTRLTAEEAALAALQGAGYGFQVSQPSDGNVTGVTLVHPNTVGGSLADTYTLSFVDASPYPKLQWGGGALVTLNSGSTRYTLIDSLGGYVFADVIIGSLPAGSASDADVVVSKMNVKDLYDRIGSSQTQNVATHQEQVHGDGLVTVPEFTADGVTLDVIYSNVAVLIDGTRYPQGGTDTDTVSFDLVASGGALAADEAKLDVVSMDSAGNVTVTVGDAFKIAYGVSSVATVPTGEQVLQYCYVAGNRGGGYIVQSDLIAPGHLYEWQAARDLVLAAKDAHGSGQDEELGLAVEPTRLISGITLNIHRLFDIEQPSTITGVSVDQLDDTDRHVPYYGTSTQGTRTLLYTFPAQTLKWDTGAAVLVSTNGTYTLEDGDGNAIQAVVVAASLPGSTVSDDLQIGYLPTVGKGEHLLEYDATLQELTLDGGTPVNIGSMGRHRVTDTDGKYLEVIVDDANSLPVTDVQDTVLVYDNSLMWLDLKMQEIMRMLGTQGATASDGTNLRTWKIGKVYDDGDFHLQYGSDVLAKSADFTSASDTESANFNRAVDADHDFGWTRVASLPAGEFVPESPYGSVTLFGMDFRDGDATNTDWVVGVSGDAPIADPPPFRNARRWVSAEATLQEHDWIGFIPIPQDFSSWAQSLDIANFSLFLESDTTDPTDQKIDVEVYQSGSGGYPYVDAADNVSTIGSGQEEQIDITQTAGTVTSGLGHIVARLRGYSKDSHYVQLNKLVMRYRRKPY